MKLFKKLVSLFTASACALCFSNTALAAQSTINQPIISGIASEEGIVIGSFTQNEYDMYLALQNTPSTLLIENGYSEEEITTIQNTSVEELLYKQAQLSEEELHNLGYSDTDIKILKNYDGSPLVQNPQLRASFAELTGVVYLENYGTTKMAAKFAWSWNKSPLLAGVVITDIVTCGFAGTNEDNVASVMTFDSSNSSCVISYYDGNLKHLEDKKRTISVKNVHQHVEVKFPMSDAVNNGAALGWAKNGYLKVGIKEEKTVNKLYSSTFAFGYGHTTISLDPNISVSVGSGFSGGVGLSFNPHTENMFYKTIVLKKDGKYDIYNGD